VLGQPKAWLGTAYHLVLQGAASGDTAAAHEAAWVAAINQQHDRARGHPLDRRFGPPERWPGYHLVRAMALLRAQEIANASRNAPGAEALEAKETGREHWLSSANGRLVGRPDLIHGDAVIDYKTGEVHEQGDSSVAKASYVRQLQIYAFLARERMGKWPARGVLLPMAGPPLEIDLEPAACERAASEALHLLDNYNHKIEAGGLPASLANPSPEACKWCPYQILCPAFWMAAGDSWIEQLGTAAIGGTAPAAPRPIYGGAALALLLSADNGTGPLGEVTLAPLSPEVHTSLVLVQAGMCVRVTGLARRADGTVVPTMRSVIARSEDVPNLTISDQTVPQER